MNTFFSKLRRYFLIKLVVVFSLLFSAFSGANYFEMAKNLEIFANLYRELNMHYVDEINPGEIMKVGIDAMLESLDPYTNFIPEADIEDYRFMTTGQYGGIGSLIRKSGDFIVITEPYEGFPAHKAGLRPGDIILEVDGMSIEGKSTSDVSEMLKGQSGTALTIKYERQGETFDTSLTREEIKIPNVPYTAMLDDEVGYISLSGFTETAGKEVKEAFLELKKQDMKKLIFDLRGNGGGLLRESVDIVNFFVEKGQEVVFTKGRTKDTERVHAAKNNPLDLDIPLVVLVDGGSASASEIVSGAVQDLDRGVVIGKTTFGKGLVQQTRDLEYNAKLKLTIAKYYTPSGRCIQRIDYSHKDDEGKADAVADSLLGVFYTKGGREVTDGRGVEPDIKISDRTLSKISISLLSKNLIFDYATKFMYENESISSPSEFEITDEIYNDFVAFLSDKDYDYTTKTENTLKELKEIASEEQYFQYGEEEYQLLWDKLIKDKKGDLQKFRDEISEFLKLEIVSRYYHRRGRIEASLQSDDYIKEALNVLNSEEKYKAILSGPKTNQGDGGN
jgi:carboxyl-terminal processing protease